MDLSDVRVNIDRIDAEMRKLFVERMGLSDQVACIKAKNEDAIYKGNREVEIINKHLEGVDPLLHKEYTSFIKRIMTVSRKYQYGRTLELRDCFPFAYKKDMPSIQKLAMTKQELYICNSFSKDAVVTVDDYDQIGDKILSHEVEAGMGIIEEIGVSVKDGLHDLLDQKQLYITDCQIVEENGVKKKVVTFMDQLVVLPEHNRLKLVFVCPNCDGSLSGILSMISDYGVNLTEIHSHPFKDGDQWNYKFFVELEANLDTKDSRSMVYQLYSETDRLSILGSYTCEDVY